MARLPRRPSWRATTTWAQAAATRGTATDDPHFRYTSYYCTYVGSPEYEDAKRRALARGVDFEAFFVHYAEPPDGAGSEGPLR
jgi:hypothetical protein